MIIIIIIIYNNDENDNSDKYINITVPEKRGL